MLGKKKRIILMTSATIALSLSLIAGWTYALFSDSVTVNNHLAAGSLKVGLYRTKLTEYKIDESGVMADITDTTRVDLLKDSSNVFTFDKIAPTYSQQTTIEVSNLGTVAFDYGAKILYSKNDDELNLASQLQVSFIQDDVELTTFNLTDSSLEKNQVELGSLLVNDSSKEFVVKIQFVDSEDNNLAQEKSLSFDLQVFAIQKVA